MAYESPSFYASFPATTGLSQYQFVTLSTNGLLIDPTTLGNAVGVLVSSGTTGSTWAGSTANGPVQTVQLYGIAKLLTSSTAITPGTLISAVTTGAEIGWAQSGADNAALWVLGIAVSQPNTTGGDSTGGIGAELISVLLHNIAQATTVA